MNVIGIRGAKAPAILQLNSGSEGRTPLLGIRAAMAVIQG
jgi:hypothetical protein